MKDAIFLGIIFILASRTLYISYKLDKCINKLNYFRKENDRLMERNRDLAIKLVESINR